MALQGELKNMPLSDILQSLKANHQSGTLNLQDGKKEFALFFEKDAISCVSPGRSSREYFPPIICLFLNITKAKMEREFKKKLNLSIAKRLGKSRIASAAKINALHRVYLTEFLYEAFAWQSGSFRFEEGTIPSEVFDDDQRDAGLKLDIDQVLFESMRRFDEWKIISKNIPTMDDVFTLTDEFKPQVEQLNEPVREIIELCNGEHSVREIAYRLGKDLFITASVLNNALEQQVIRLIGPNDLIALAEHHFSTDRREEALQYFKRAIELDRGNIDVRIRFANLCVQRGMNDEATNEFKILAQLSREKQEYEKAKGFYRKIIILNPSEYEFQKRLYEMLREIKDQEARTTGFELANTLKRLGLRFEEVQVLNQLVEDNAGDIECIERLGDAERSLGHDKVAIDHYLAAAELSIKNDDLQNACTNFENVLLISPDETRIKKWLDELQSGIYLKKRRQRHRLIIATEIGAVFILICSYLIYCAFSFGDYLDLRNQNIQNLVEEDLNSVEASIDNFKKHHPLSLVNLDLERYHDMIVLFAAKRQSNSKSIISNPEEVVSDTLLHLTEKTDASRDTLQSVHLTNDSLQLKKNLE